MKKRHKQKSFKMVVSIHPRYAPRRLCRPDEPPLLTERVPEKTEAERMEIVFNNIRFLARQGGYLESDAAIPLNRLYGSIAETDELITKTIVEYGPKLKSLGITIAYRKH